MALTKLFMSLIWVGQLYYGWANLLKVCASNLILSTSNLRYRKIMYKVDLGWGLVSKPWIQIHKINLQERNISLIPSSGFMEMGYKHYNWHCNWICMFFGQKFGTCTASREFGVCRTYVWQLCNYFKSLTGQVLWFNMTSDSLFVSLTRPDQLWISDSGELGHKMKRIHEGGDGMNSPGGPRRQKLSLRWWKPIPRHQAEEAFHFFELSTGWHINSEYTVERDQCNVTHWSMCVKSFINTSNKRYWALFDTIWQV